MRPYCLIRFLSILLFLVLKVSTIHIWICTDPYLSASQPNSLFLQFSHPDLYVSTCVSVTWVVPYARYTYVNYPISTWIFWFYWIHSIFPSELPSSHKPSNPTQPNLEYFSISLSKFVQHVEIIFFLFFFSRTFCILYD